MGALPDDYFEKCLGGIRHAALARANLVASAITRLICTLTGQLDEALLVLSGACVSHSPSPQVGQQDGRMKQLSGQRHDRAAAQLFLARPDGWSPDVS
jgi:hypothetical protein